MDYLTDIKPLEDAGMTDADIASHNANKTLSPIPCDSAKILLEETGLVIEDPITRVRSGALVDRYNAMPANQLKALLGWFISHVFGRGTQITSNSNPRSIQLAAVLADLPAGLAQVGQDLLALGGGQPYAGTVEADVVAARDAWNADEAQRVADEAAATAASQAEMEHVEWQNDYQGRWNSTVAPVLDTRPRDNAALVAALQALASDLSSSPWSP